MIELMLHKAYRYWYKTQCNLEEENMFMLLNFILFRINFSGYGSYGGYGGPYGGGFGGGFGGGPF